jgi:hypothetical protein
VINNWRYFDGRKEMRGYPLEVDTWRLPATLLALGDRATCFDVFRWNGFRKRENSQCPAAIFERLRLSLLPQVLTSHSVG